MENKNFIETIKEEGKKAKEGSYAKEIAGLIGNSKLLSLEDPFNFKCDGCGECCKNRNDIILSPLDIFKLAKGLNISSQDVIEKYGQTFLGRDSKLPLVLLKYKEVNVGIYDYTVCPFLRKKEGKGLCSVHAFKPWVCNIYPLGRIISGAGELENKQFFLQDVSCGLRDEEHKPIDWIGSSNYNEHDSVGDKYSDLVGKLARCVDLPKLNKKAEKNKKAEDIQNIIYTAVYTILYHDLDTTRTAEEVLNERYNTLEKMLNVFKEAASEMKCSRSTDILKA